MPVSERALVSKLAEIEVRVLLPLGEGLEIGHLRNEGWTFRKGVLGEKSSRRPFAPPSRRGGRADPIMRRYLKKSARPGRSDAVRFRIASRIVSRTAWMF